MEDAMIDAPGPPGTSTHNPGENRAAHRDSSERRQVAGGRHLTGNVKPVRREVVRVPEMESSRLRIHQRNELLRSTRDGVGKREGGVVTGGKKHAVEEIPHAQALPRIEPGGRSAVGNGV